MKQVTTQAIEHIDVRGKKLYYLKLSNGPAELLVNVGKKTYDSVKAMEKHTEILTEKIKGNK